MVDHRYIRYIVFVDLNSMAMQMTTATREFLVSLTDAKSTPRIPLHLRENARRLLRQESLRLTFNPTRNIIKKGKNEPIK